MSETDLAGRWAVVKVNAEMASRPRDFSETRIDICPDGTFVGHKLPRMLVSLSLDDYDKTFDGRGHWRLATVGRRRVVELAIQLPGSVQSAEIGVHRTSSEFYLHHDSDPDVAPEVIYQRVNVTDGTLLCK